jgi:outer membrane receptor protein involved in Fe transport
MLIQSRIQRALSSFLAAGSSILVFAVAPGSALAADTSEPALEEVVVTGSRLSEAGFNAPSPVTVVNIATIEQRAPANIADAINEQPAFRVTQSDTTRGGNAVPGAGQQTLNLRALGSTRTLVLINSHRVAPTLWDGTVDTSIVPVGLVERIEVVTGGASAAYGSDAIAGVTNIILRNKMQGLRASVQEGLSEYDSGKQYTATLAGGTSFMDGRLNIIGGVDYNDSKAIGNPYGKAWGAAETQAVTPSAAQRAASAGNLLPQTYLTNGVEPGNVAPGGIFQVSQATATTPSVAYTFDANGNPVRFDQGTLWGNNGTQAQLMSGSTANYGYNGGSIQALRIPSSRIDLYSRASFDISDRISAYVEFNKSRNKTDPYKFAEYTSIGAFNITAGSPTLTISRTNPFVTPAMLALLTPTQATFNLSRLNTEFGLSSGLGLAGQSYRATTDVSRVVAGLQGKFGASWHWEAYYQTGKADLFTNRVEFSPTAFQRAVDNCASFVGLNAAQQAAVAQYEAFTGKTCTPFNPFGVGRNPVSAQNYFMNLVWTRQEISQDVFSASLSGSPLTLPAGPLAIAVGAEYQRQDAKGTVDPLTAIGGLLSNNFQPLARDNMSSKGINVREAFTEIGIPLLKDKPGVQSLDLNAAARRTDYSQSGAVTTWKAGFTWDPFTALRVRYTRSRDIRAPNLNELFFQGGLGAQAALINRTPVGTVGAGGTVNNNPAGINNTAQVNAPAVGPSGGGSALSPEIADTHTAGIVVRTGGFSSSVDYYQIRINGIIATANNQQVIDLCRDGDARACQMITFNDVALGTGGIGLIAPTAQNLNLQTIQGYDAEVGYRLPLMGGNFSVRALVNYQPRNRSYNVLTKLTTEAANVLGNQPLVGYNLSFGFDKGKLGLDLQVRGFTGRRGNALIYNTDGSLSTTTVLGPEDEGYAARLNPAINDATTNKNRFGGQYTINPSVSYKFTDHISAFANVDNLLDVDPPALTTNNAYDLIGRRYRAGVRAEF